MSQLMSDAINLMLVGMSFVFVFLVVLVVVTTVMSRIVNKYSPIPEPAALNASKSNDEINTMNDVQLMAVLSAAVAKYRSDHKK